MQQEHRVVDDPEPGGAAGERQHDRLAEAAGHVRGELEGAAALGVDGGLDEAGDNDGAVAKLGGLRFAGHLELHPRLIAIVVGRRRAPPRVHRPIARAGL